MANTDPEVEQDLGKHGMLPKCETAMPLEATKNTSARQKPDTSNNMSVQVNVREKVQEALLYKMGYSLHT